MKYLINLFLLLVPFVAVTAQKSIDQGYVKMEVKEAASKIEDPNVEMIIELLKSSSTEIFFTEGKYKTSLVLLGGMMKMDNVVDLKANKMDILAVGMGKKVWVNSKLDSEKTEEQKMAAFKVVYDKSQTKTILGYNAYKATVTIPNNPGMTVNGWVSDEIKTNANIIQGMADLKLDGFPLEFTIENTKMKVTFAASEIKEAVDASVFVVRTEGYEKMTMKEFSDSMGGMGGLGI